MFIERFFQEEHGHAVVDWVVLLAGSVFLALSIVVTVTANIDHITDDTNSKMESMEEWRPS